ncbi:MAG: hypothetical protein LJE85_15270 [Gammaproteobacteria bacterium]|jgi:hypothetical protein|nr:hypothetical protein [Gammaproteobacteria bacterium]
MKRWFLIALVLGALYYYAGYTQPGKKQFHRVAIWFEQWTGQKIGHIGAVDSAGETTVYKIQNPDGSWTFSNEKPKDGSRAVEQRYRSDANVVPSVSEDAREDAPEGK